SAGARLRRRTECMDFLCASSVFFAFFAVKSDSLNRKECKEDAGGAKKKTAAEMRFTRPKGASPRQLRASRRRAVCVRGERRARAEAAPAIRHGGSWREAAC